FPSQTRTGSCHLSKIPKIVNSKPEPIMTPASGVYDACKSTIPVNTTNSDTAVQEQILQCIASSNANSIDTFFLIYASSLVFFMQAGFAMLCAGSVQKKNVQNTMLKNLLDACGAALSFYAVGFAFAFGGSYEEENAGKTTFIGTSYFFLVGMDDVMFWMFQFAFAATSATIVAGTLAERCQMTAYLCYSLVLTGFVYPVVVHSVWSPQGFLSSNRDDPLWGCGFIDFAGSTVVHFTGGLTALVATYLLGPRRGRFYDFRGRLLDTPNPMPGHSAALQMLGAFVLWFGWYGFNTGSAISITGPDQNKIISIAAVNTTLAAASSCFSALAANYIIAERRTGEGEFSLKAAMNGCLSGLVAITGGCAVVEPWAAVIIGLFAGLIYLFSSSALIRLCIDDAVDAVPVHMSNGAFGSIAVGLFGSPTRLELAYGHSNHVGLLYSGDGILLGAQFCGVLFVLGWVTLLMFPFFCILNYFGWFRSDVLNEIAGLDASYHGARHVDVDGVDMELVAQLRSQPKNSRNRFSRSSAEPNLSTTNLDSSDVSM
ncbi:hypothetical protein HJC23_001806, partial [Cyclotella cryptica]